jgi:hypothetical protein
MLDSFHEGTPWYLNYNLLPLVVEGLDGFLLRRSELIFRLLFLAKLSLELLVVKSSGLGLEGSSDELSI